MFRGDSSEYIQHAIIVQKIGKISQNDRHLLPDLALWLSLRDQNFT